MSDIDTAVVDGLKVLDPNGRLEKLPRGPTLGAVVDDPARPFLARCVTKMPRSPTIAAIREAGPCEKREPQAVYPPWGAAGLSGDGAPGSLNTDHVRKR